MEFLLMLFMAIIASAVVGVISVGLFLIAILSALYYWVIAIILAIGSFVYLLV